MAQKFSSKKRAFTYGEHLVIIQDGKFSPIDLDEERFKEVISQMLDSKWKAVNAELVLQEAIKKYTGISILVRFYKGLHNSESEFYCNWKKYIQELEKFKEVNPIAYKERQRKKEIEVKERIKDGFNRSCTVESMRRSK